MTAVSSAGAGDAYLAGVMAGLVAGAPFMAAPPRRRTNLGETPLQTACDYATVVAALSVTSPHTIHPGLDAAAVREFATARGLVAMPAGRQQAGGREQQAGGCERSQKGA